jgi:hypothetical protein
MESESGGLAERQSVHTLLSMKDWKTVGIIGLKTDSTVHKLSKNDYTRIQSGVTKYLKTLSKDTVVIFKEGVGPVELGAKTACNLLGLQSLRAEVRWRSIDGTYNPGAGQTVNYWIQASTDTCVTFDLSGNHEQV